MRYPAVAGENQADANRANLSPLSNHDMQFQAQLAKAVLNRTSIDRELCNVMNDRFTTWHFDRHSGGVYIYALSVNHAGATVSAFDGEVVPVPKFIRFPWVVPNVKYLGT